MLHKLAIAPAGSPTMPMDSTWAEKSACVDQ